MFDRLKSLPLTIVLTVLIWMYAESQVTSSQPAARLEVADVPVWISGPPGELSKYEVKLETKTVTVTVSGAGAAIEALKLRMQNGEDTEVQAYLDAWAKDVPPNTKLRGLLRYVLPDGIKLLSGPAEATYYLRSEPAASAPATADNTGK